MNIMLGDLKVNQIENTLENKAKFFAQYYGQKVVSLMGDFTELDTLFLAWGPKSCYIHLKPLSLITDEDAKTVATIFNYDKEYNALRPQEIGANRFRLIQETIFPHFMQTTFMHFNFLFLKVTHYPGWAYR